MTRPDDEFPPLDVTSTLNLGSLDEVLEGPDTDVVPSRMSGSLPPGWRCWWSAGARTPVPGSCWTTM